MNTPNAIYPLLKHTSIFLLLLFLKGTLVYGQESETNKYLGVYSNLGNLAFGGFDIGLENYLTESFDMRILVRLDDRKRGNLAIGHILMEQQLLWYPRATKTGICLIPNVRIGESSYYQLEGPDRVLAFCFGAGMNAEYTFHPVKALKLSLGCGFGMNYLNYKHEGADSPYGYFNPSILKDDPLNLSDHWEMDPRIVLSICYSKGFRKL